MQALLESVADCLSTTLGQGKVTLPPSALQVTRLREGMEEPVTLLLQRYQDVLPVLPDPKGLERANSHCGPACHDDRTSPIWDWSIKGTALALEVSDRALVSQCLKTTLLRDQDGASQGWELALTSFPDARAYLYVKSLTASSPLRYQTGKVQHIGAFIADHDHHGFRPFQDPLLGSLMSPTDLADDFISVTTCNRSCNDLLSPLDVVTSSSQRIFLVDQSPEGNAWMRKWKALKKESNSSSYPLEEWVTLGPCPYSLKDLEGMAKRLADEEFPPSCSEWLDAEKVKEACRICAWTTLAFTFLSPRLTSPMKIDFATMARERPGVYVQYTHSRLSGIIRSAMDEGIPQVVSEEGLNSLVATMGPESRMLCARLLLLQDHLAYQAQSPATFTPSALSQNLTRLARAVTRAQYTLRVKGTEKGLASARLALLVQSRLALAQGLELLGLHALEYM